MAYPKKYDADLDAKISILYQTGHSTYQIAKMVNQDSSFIQRSLKRTKTPKRTLEQSWELRKAAACS